MDKSIWNPEHKWLRDLLRKTREEAGLRQADVAKRIGEPQNFVSKYETGTRRLDLTELRMVCRALGITLGELVERFEKGLPR